jgi:protein-tyrosine phosphatase
VNVLFVCTGNICRSPFAEGVARRFARERGLDAEFASAGTHAVVGGVTDEGLAAAREHGVDLAAHTAQQLSPALVEWADVVVAMAPHHLTDSALAGIDRAATFAVGEIRDPYGLGPAAYRRAYEEIEQAVSELLDELAVGAQS